MPTPKLTTILGGVTEAGVRTGLIGYFDSTECKARMDFPLALITENTNERDITAWPAMTVQFKDMERGAGEQAREASLELRLYMKEERAEVGDREMRQLCNDVETQIRVARHGQLWGAKGFRWERTQFLGVGDIKDGEQGVVVAVLTYTVLYVEQFA